MNLICYILIVCKCKYLHFLMLLRIDFHISDLLISDCSYKIKIPSQVSDRPYKCNLCGKGYAWKISLNRHLREECGKLPQHVCFCGKKFKQRSSFMRHMINVHNSS